MTCTGYAAEKRRCGLNLDFSAAVSPPWWAREQLQQIYIAAVLTGRAIHQQRPWSGQELSAVKGIRPAQKCNAGQPGQPRSKGTVAENLRTAAPRRGQHLWAVLKQVRLADFLRSESRLDTS